MLFREKIGGTPVQTEARQDKGDLIDKLVIFDGGDDAHSPSAARTHQRVDFLSLISSSDLSFPDHPGGE
jgi:hypothetical protein